MEICGNALCGNIGSYGDMIDVYRGSFCLAAGWIVHPGLGAHRALDPLDVSSHSGHQLRPVQAARLDGHTGRDALGAWRFKHGPLCQASFEPHDPVCRSWRILEAVVVSVGGAVVDHMEYACLIIRKGRKKVRNRGGFWALTRFPWQLTSPALARSHP